MAITTVKNKNLSKRRGFPPLLGQLKRKEGGTVQKWKNWILPILYPGKVLTWIIPILGFSLLVFIFYKGWENTPLAYLSYVLAFYSLILLILGSIPVIVQGRKAYYKFRQKNPYYLRTSLLRSLGINAAYGLFQLASGLYYHSAWFFSCGIYYLVLSLIRLVLVRYERKQSACADEGEKRFIGWSGFRAVGVWMLFLNMAMTGMVFQMIWRGQGGHYQEIMVYAVAAYTFYRLTMSLIRVIQRRGKFDPLEGAARNINLTAAVMSLYSLQVTMLNVFDNGMDNAVLMNSLSGAGVCLLVILGALGMALHGHKQKKMLSI